MKFKPGDRVKLKNNTPSGVYAVIRNSHIDQKYGDIVCQVVWRYIDTDQAESTQYLYERHLELDKRYYRRKKLKQILKV